MTGLELLGLAMLIVMIGAIFIGFPISFTLLFLALAFGYLALERVVFDLAYFQTIGMMKEELLAAVPLFIFMGYITEQAGLMERLFSAFRLLFAPVRGSLFIVVIVTSTVFAMATGIVGASVTVLGIMAAPLMIKTGYDSKLSAGAITAGGTLGILIPPSVMLIVMGPVLGVSVADLYSAAFGPGFLLAGIYLTYLITRSFINPKLGPPVPIEERVTDPVAIIKEVAVGVLPLLLLIVATLGSILAGLATPTEAAGIGAVFARMGTANWITDAMVALPVPPIVMLSFVIVLLFLLGWPFEWPAIILVFLPIFYPVVDALRPALSQSLGIQDDLFMVWFGSLVAVTMQTAFLSPPVAMSAYYLKQVVKEWSLLTIYKGMFEFMVLQCIAIAIIMFVPSIATKLPEHLRSEQRAIETQDVDDSMNRLEEDPLKAAQEPSKEEEPAAEKK